MYWISALDESMKIFYGVSVVGLLLRVAGNVACKGEIRNAYRCIIGSESLKGWDDNIKRDFKGIGERVWAGFLWVRIGSQW
jgi:hypothetical protein